MKKAASSCIPDAAWFSACGTFWMPNSPDFATLMAAGMKEVVCTAAYNTLSEGAVLEEERAGHPAKLARAEETTRVRLLTERHLIDVLHPASLSQETLAQREVEDMERVDYPPRDPALHGATQAARCLEALVDEGPYAPAA